MTIPEFVEYVKKKYAECKFKDCLDVIEDIQRRMVSIVSDDIDLLEEFWKRIGIANERTECHHVQPRHNPVVLIAENCKLFVERFLNGLWSHELHGQHGDSDGQREHNKCAYQLRHRQR